MHGDISIFLDPIRQSTIIRSPNSSDFLWRLLPEMEQYEVLQFDKITWHSLLGKI